MFLLGINQPNIQVHSSTPSLFCDYINRGQGIYSAHARRYDVPLSEAMYNRPAIDHITGKNNVSWVRITGHRETYLFSNLFAKSFDTVGIKKTVRKIEEHMLHDNNIYP